MIASASSRASFQGAIHFRQTTTAPIMTAPLRKLKAIHPIDSAFSDAVTKTADRLDRVRRFAQLLPQSPNVRVDGARVDETFVTPDFIEQPVAMLNAPLPTHQHAQQLELDPG